MNFSAWSIRKPIPSILLFVILMIMGLYSFSQLSVENFPDIELPAIVVTTSLNGATPTQLETEVTRKIENAVATIGEVEHIRSTVTDGVSTTSILFALGKDLQQASDDVRDAVARIRTQLPANVDDPIISRVTFAGAALLTYAVEARDMDELDLSWFVDNTVAKSLLAISGVAQVSRQGGVDREVRVELDPTRLQAYGVTAADISNRLQSIQQDTSGGRGTIGGSEQAMRAIGTIASVEALASMNISLADGRRMALSDVASLRDTAAERRQMALLDGKQVVSFQVFRANGHGEVAVGRDVRKGVQKLREQYPNLKITEISNLVDMVQDQYVTSMHALYEGAVLAVIVVALFLRSKRATFVAAVALPLSIIPTFWAMNTMDFSLNTVTLLALTLVVGILVDDAIVEVENIVRHSQMGKSPFQAALEAADEIGMAVIATSLTLVAVFLPTSFMSGLAGKFFKQFGWTAALAVLTSLLVARLLTPMMAAYLLKPSKVTHAPDGPVMRRYLAAVHWCLAHPFKTSALTALFFIASLLLATRLPVSVFPAEDHGQITVKLELTPGSRIDETAAVAEQARRIAAQLPEVHSVYTAIGAATQGDNGTNSSADVRSASLIIDLNHARQRSQLQIESELRKRLALLPGTRVSIGMGGTGERYTMALASDDAALLQSTAQRIERDMRSLHGFGGVSSSASLLRPEIVIRPDAARAADLGVTTQAIGQAVRVATTGDFTVNLAKLNLPARQIPIRVALDPEARNRLDTIEELRVASRNGTRNGTVPLGQVARIGIESGPAQIDRLDRSRNVNINLELAGRPLSDATRLIDALPSVQQLPAGVRRIASGDAETQGRLVINFILAMIAGIFCVYTVLVLLFHNFLQPVTILAALPLAAGGAFGALWLCGYPFSMSSLIGLLMLMGVVTKNSILLVEYAIVAQRERGLGRTEAIIDACHKRARPIIMTTIAMMAGMLPMAVGLEGEGSFRAPMAVAVIGGLATSTFLSLLVVPAVFEMVDDLRNTVLGWFVRKPKVVAVV